MEKQKKFLLVLPLLVLPFITFGFWALGGGKGQEKETAPTQGLSTELPGAKFKDKENTDKMSVYQTAKPDSVNDGISPAFLNALGGGGKTSTKTDSPGTTEAQAEQIQHKLTQLNRQLEQPVSQREPVYDDANEAAQLKKLEKLRKRAGLNQSAEDPELKQLDKMLDKIQAIQNPATTTEPQTETPAEPAKPFRAIPAIIDGKQKVADGAAVRLRLTDTASIKGQLLDKGQLLFGSCQVINQRLLVNIKNIRLGTQIIPVELTVFSEDGMQGIPAPEAELGGIAAGNADQTLRGMQVMSMDQSVAAQVAAGGINAAKDLFSKKVKKIKVKLEDGVPILLKINRP